MTLTEKKAEQIRTAITPQVPDMAIDPAIFTIIIQIIQAVMKMISDCKKPPTEVITMSKEPRLYHRFHLRRVIRQKLHDEEMNDFISPKLMSTMFQIGSELTQEEAKQLGDENG